MMALLCSVAADVLVRLKMGAYAIIFLTANNYVICYTIEAYNRRREMKLGPARL